MFFQHMLLDYLKKNVVSRLPREGNIWHSFLQELIMTEVQMKKGNRMSFFSHYFVTGKCSGEYTVFTSSLSVLKLEGG